MQFHGRIFQIGGMRLERRQENHTKMQGTSCADIFTRKIAIVDAQNTPVESKH